MLRIRYLRRVFCAVFAAVPVFAADFWLRPDRFSATPGATLGAEITVWDESVPFVLPAMGRVSLTLADSDLPVGIDPGAENRRGQRVSATFVRPGWAVWSVDISPQPETLTVAQLEPRLQLLHAPPVLRLLAAAPDSAQTWRLVSRLTLKCLARIGEPDAEDRSWARLGGNAWDLVPQSDPASFRVGQVARFTVLAAGRPAAGSVVTLRCLGADREIAASSGLDGTATFVVPVSGLWLASASHVQRSFSDDSQLEVRSVSLVFEVR